ncbi:hypothetical protein HZA39_01050 [Candidatus Peregrinibacteria bacterium]|nr:hypothetical protein [Candidatus Peregrinibacteria bacterium]
MGIEDIFKNFGLNSKQIQVLMASMELGSQPVSTIARKTNLNRTTVYVLLNELAKMGFISKFSKLNVQYFTPASPSDIIGIIKRKKDEYSRYEQELKLILPELQSKFNPYISKSKVNCFEGSVGIKNVIEDILKSRTEIFAYKNVDCWITGQAYEIMKDFDAKRISRKIEMKAVVQDTPDARAYFSDAKNRKFAKIKWIKSAGQKFANEIYIYTNKIAMISFTTGSMFGVIIEADENTQTQKAVFDLAWRAR